MKSFQQFIQEARSTIASQKASQMGLQSSGHGDYYDQQGNLVAKTIGGKLQFFKGRRGKSSQEKPKPVVRNEPQPQAYNSQPQIDYQPSPVQNEVKGIVLVIGRFNPPARNHELMLKYGYSRAKEKNYEFRIYPSRVQEKASNPLNPSLKVQVMQMMYPNFADYILDSEDMKTIFDVLNSLYNEGFKDVKIIVGAERVGEIQSLVHRNQGQGYEFENIEVLAAPGKDPDSDTSGSGSSVALRSAALNGDFQSFSMNLPSSMKLRDKEWLFNSVSKSMKLNENYELWKIAPELYKNELRKQYKENNLYSIGSLIENMNTGLRGRVIRRGTNYLICLTDDGTMFKSWVSSVHLPEDVYEVGTDKYRKFLQDMTPGQPTYSFTGIPIRETIPKNINKLRNQLFNKK